MVTRILLADDHTPFRQTLRAFLDEQPDLEVVAEAADGPAALRLARALAPDVVLMDVVLPGLNGIETTRAILAAQPSLEVIALSIHADPRLAAAMRRAGAAAYLVKENAAIELDKAIRAVVAGWPVGPPVPHTAPAERPTSGFLNLQLVNYPIAATEDALEARPESPRRAPRVTEEGTMSTNVSQIVNETNNFNQVVNIVNTENASDNIMIAPNNEASQPLWIPWCDDAPSFPEHHIAISAKGHVYYIWQHEGNIHGSATGYGESVDTLSINIGGQFTLNISPDFTVTLL